MQTVRSLSALRRPRAITAAAALVCLLAAGMAGADTSPVQHAIALIDAGHFKAADADIAQALAQPSLSADTRDALQKMITG